MEYRNYFRSLLLLTVIPVYFGRKFVSPVTSVSSISQQLGRVASVCSSICASGLLNCQKVAIADDAPQGKLEYMPALQGLDYGKPRTFYPDFIQKQSGLQYKVVKEGTGNKTPSKGDRVVVDWEGYTIGYYGRPFQTRNKVKGGAFDSTETDYFRWIVGSGSAVQALDEAVQYMKEGGVLQVIVPAELGYPIKGDPEHDVVGPKPSTFSGLRALNFVLDNQNLIDKTLLINIRLVKIEEGYAKRKNIKI